MNICIKYLLCTTIITKVIHKLLYIRTYGPPCIYVYTIYIYIYIQWIPLNVGSRIMWTFYQGWILYYVYYITSDNLGSRLMWTLSGIHCIYIYVAVGTRFQLESMNYLLWQASLRWHLELQEFLARRHLHRLVLQPLVQLQYNLFFPREEERTACRSEIVTSGTSPG